MRRCLHGIGLSMLCLAVTIIPGKADAQFADALGGHWNNPGSALLGTMITNRILLKSATGKDQPGTAASPTPPIAAAPTTFRPAATRSIVKELAQSMGADDKTRGDLARLFEYYLQSFDEQTQRDREPAHDVGRAAAYFLMANYTIVSGQLPTDRQADGAQAKFRAGLAGNPDFARMTDRDRQRLYETLVILGSLPLTGTTDAQQKKDKGREQMFHDLARQNIRTLLGVPAEKIRLTDDGFRIDE